MCKQALTFHARLTANCVIKEDLCFDGLENFAGTQYDPNNIQQAIGRDSLFLYDFNFAPLNRKGRTSIWQKERLREIVGTHGRYDPGAIRVATREILSRILKASPNLVLLTDEHFQYRRAVAGLNLKQHITINSKACRNFQNILFAVNHADLLIRKNMGAFARETIAFSKTAGRMCQKFALFMIFKNYMSPQFTKRHKRRLDAHQNSPAQALGLCEKLLGFSDIFSERSLSPSELNPDWKHFWAGVVPPQYLRSRAYA